MIWIDMIWHDMIYGLDDINGDLMARVTYHLFII